MGLFFHRAAAVVVAVGDSDSQFFVPRLLTMCLDNMTSRSGYGVGDFQGSNPLASYKLMAPGKVLDYSFMGVGHVEEVVELDPANVEELVKDDSRGTKPVMAVRLSYNHLADLGPAFSSTLSGLTGNGLASLRWLDLSFNSIENVEPLLDLQELAVLYLHSNKIEKVSEVRSLAALSKLHKLTLHGNPVEEKKQYRSMVLHHVPTLHELDFSCVTHRDREKSHMWAEFNRKALRQGERDDERTTPAY